MSAHLRDRFTAAHAELAVELAAAETEAAAWLYAHGEVHEDRWREDGRRLMRVKLSPIARARWEKRFGAMIRNQ